MTTSVPALKLRRCGSAECSPQDCRPRIAVFRPITYRNLVCGKQLNDETAEVMRRLEAPSDASSRQTKLRRERLKEDLLRLARRFHPDEDRAVQMVDFTLAASPTLDRGSPNPWKPLFVTMHQAFMAQVGIPAAEGDGTSSLRGR